MLKIATVILFLAALACHAAPQGRKNSETGGTSGNSATRNSIWGESGNARRQQGQRNNWNNRSRDQQTRNQIEEPDREQGEGSGPNELRKTNWQYEIEHIQENRERGTEVNQQGARRGTGGRWGNDVNNVNNEQTQEEEQEEQGEQENQQEDEQSNQQEEQEEVDQIDQRDQAENRRRRPGNGGGRDSGRGRNEQQRSGNRQESRLGGSQEQSTEEAEQTDEQEDQIQVEQEVNEENRQEGGSQENENNEGNGSPNYEFAYGVNDPATGDHKDQWEKRVGDHLEGGYVLALPDGTKRVVQYKHDGKRGFETNIMQIERKKASEKSTNSKKEKSKKVAHSYSKVKQVN